MVSSSMEVQVTQQMPEQHSLALERITGAIIRGAKVIPNGLELSIEDKMGTKVLLILEATPQVNLQSNGVFVSMGMNVRFVE